MAQSLESHLWQDRVVLLFATDNQQVTFRKQLDLLEENADDLSERKLVIYQITADNIKKDGVDLPNKTFRKKVFEKYQTGNNEFTFILIGLDGGEKMRSTKLVPLAKLFGKIDRMPMRKAEMDH